MQSETLVAEGVHNDIMTPPRIKVHIRCRHCGETFILRGARDSNGRIETGFKRCLCNNEDDFEIEPLN